MNSSLDGDNIGASVQDSRLLGSKGQEVENSHVVLSQTDTVTHFSLYISFPRAQESLSHYFIGGGTTGEAVAELISHPHKLKVIAHTTEPLKLNLLLLAQSEFGCTGCNCPRDR